MDNKKKNIILLVCALIITVVYICTMPFWCGNGIVTALIYLVTLAIYKQIPKTIGIIVVIVVIFFFGFGIFLARSEQFFAGLVDFILLLWIITLIKNIIKDTKQQKVKPEYKTCAICNCKDETVRDCHVSGATYLSNGSIDKLMDGRINLCSSCAKECPKCERIIITPQIKQLLEKIKNNWNADEVDIESCKCEKSEKGVQDDSNIVQSSKEDIERFQKNLTILKKIAKFLLIIITAIAVIILLYIVGLISFNYSASKIAIDNINISENYPGGKLKIKSIYDKENHQTIISNYYENGKLKTKLFVDKTPLNIKQVLKNMLDFHYIRYGYIPFGSGIKVHRLQYYKSGNLSVDCNYILYENTYFYSELERIFENDIVYEYSENILPNSYRRLEGPLKFYYDAKHLLKTFDNKTELVPSIKDHFQYKNGRGNGKQYGYYENGAIKYKYNLKDGNETEVGIYYYPNGNKKRIIDYKKGFYNRTVKTYYPNENLRSEYQYKHGNAEGKYIEYYGNGNIKYIIKYKKGKPVNGTMYNENNMSAIMTNAHLNNGKFLEF